MHSKSPHMHALHERSGKFAINDPLVGFLYDLMIEHCTPGKVEELAMKQTHEMTTYTNGWLAQYASDLARRLRH
jgi:hypothetical protein